MDQIIQGPRRRRIHLHSGFDLPRNIQILDFSQEILLIFLTSKLIGSSSHHQHKIRFRDLLLENRDHIEIVSHEEHAAVLFIG